MEECSELNRLITAYKLGIVPNSLSVHSIKLAILSAYELRNKNYFSRELIKAAGNDLFNKHKVIQAWNGVLREFWEKSPRLNEAALNLTIDRFASKPVN